MRPKRISYVTPSLRAAVAEQVRALKKDRAWSQDELARRLRDQGFWRWTRSVVAALENEGRRVELEDVVALAIVFNVPLSQLIPPEDPDSELLRLVDGMAVPVGVVRRLLAGGLPNEDGSAGVYHAVEEAEDEYVRAAAAGDLERRISRSLGRTPEEIAVASRELWEHSATVERDARARTRPKARQHISRQIMRELADHFGNA